MLGAAITLPAFAAPAEWDFSRNEASSAAAIAPRPAAKLYHMGGASAHPLGQLIHSDAGQSPVASSTAEVGPAARALRIDNSGVDRSRAVQCLTAAIYYEAASESDSGQQAVAQVVLNRVAHPAYPGTVCGVVYQGSERTTGCQFSFTCDGSLARVPARVAWLRTQQIAREALSGYVHAPVGLATHYHTHAVSPFWAPSLAYLGAIGAHRFYRFRGPAGLPATFRFAYLGGEPTAAAHPRGAVSPPAEVLPDPVAIQRAYESGLQAAQRNAFLPAAAGHAATRPAPAPLYATDVQRRGGDALYLGEGLPGTAGVLPQYQQSGAWIAQPGN